MKHLQTRIIYSISSLLVILGLSSANHLSNGTGTPKLLGFIIPGDNGARPRLQLIPGAQQFMGQGRRIAAAPLSRLREIGVEGLPAATRSRVRGVNFNPRSVVDSVRRVIPAGSSRNGGSQRGSGRGRRQPNILVIRPTSRNSTGLTPDLIEQIRRSARRQRVGRRNGPTVLSENRSSSSSTSSSSSSSSSSSQSSSINLSSPARRARVRGTIPRTRAELIAAIRRRLSATGAGRRRARPSSRLTGISERPVRVDEAVLRSGVRPANGNVNLRSSFTSSSSSSSSNANSQESVSNTMGMDGVNVRARTASSSSSSSSAAAANSSSSDIQIGEPAVPDPVPTVTQIDTIVPGVVADSGLPPQSVDATIVPVQPDVPIINQPIVPVQNIVSEFPVGSPTNTEISIETGPVQPMVAVPSPANPGMILDTVANVPGRIREAGITARSGIQDVGVSGMNGMGLMPSVSGPATVSDVNIGVAPAAAVSDVNIGVAPAAAVSDVNIGVAPDVGVSGMNGMGLMPSVSGPAAASDVNIGVVPAADVSDVNIGVAPDVGVSGMNGMGLMSSVSGPATVSDVNIGVAPVVSDVNIGVAPAPAVSDVNIGVAPVAAISDVNIGVAPAAVVPDANIGFARPALGIETNVNDARFDIGVARPTSGIPTNINDANLNIGVLRPTALSEVNLGVARPTTGMATNIGEAEIGVAGPTAVSDVSIGLARPTTMVESNIREASFMENVGLPNMDTALNMGGMSMQPSEVPNTVPVLPPIDLSVADNTAGGNSVMDANLREPEVGTRITKTVTDTVIGGPMPNPAAVPSLTVVNTNGVDGAGLMQDTRSTSVVDTVVDRIVPLPAPAVEPTMISLPEFTAAGAVPSMVQISDTSAGLTSADTAIRSSPSIVDTVSRTITGIGGIGQPGISTKGGAMASGLNSFTAAGTSGSVRMDTGLDRQGAQVIDTVGIASVDTMASQQATGGFGIDNTLTQMEPLPFGKRQKMKNPERKTATEAILPSEKLDVIQTISDVNIKPKPAAKTDVNTIKSVVTDVLMDILSKAFQQKGNEAGLSILAETIGMPTSPSQTERSTGAKTSALSNVLISKVTEQVQPLVAADEVNMNVSPVEVVVDTAFHKDPLNKPVAIVSEPVISATSTIQKNSPIVKQTIVSVDKTAVNVDNSITHLVKEKPSFRQPIVVAHTTLEKVHDQHSRVVNSETSGQAIVNSVTLGTTATTTQALPVLNTVTVAPLTSKKVEKTKYQEIPITHEQKNLELSGKSQAKPAYLAPYDLPQSKNTNSDIVIDFGPYHHLEHETVNTKSTKPNNHDNIQHQTPHLELAKPLKDTHAPHHIQDTNIDLVVDSIVNKLIHSFNAKSVNNAYSNTTTSTNSLLGNYPVVNLADLFINNLINKVSGGQDNHIAPIMASTAKTLFAGSKPLPSNAPVAAKSTPILISSLTPVISTAASKLPEVGTNSKDLNQTLISSASPTTANVVSNAANSTSLNASATASSNASSVSTNDTNNNLQNSASTAAPNTAVNITTEMSSTVEAMTTVSGSTTMDPDALADLAEMQEEAQLLAAEKAAAAAEGGAA